MNIINLRKNLRRLSDTRRVTDRREMPYEYGSPEWKQQMQDRNCSTMPRFNRRKAERRTAERRLPDRRSHQQPEAGQIRGKKYARFFLTKGERNLIQDIYLSDLDQD